MINILFDNIGEILEKYEIKYYCGCSCKKYFDVFLRLNK